MRKLTGIFAIGIVAIALVLTPFFTGMLFQKKYRELLVFYNEQGNIHVEVLKYKRHWFHSEVTLAVDVVKLNWQGMFTALGIKQEVLPQSIHFTLEQQVTHGPIIFSKVHSPSQLFGLATIKSQLHLSRELTDIFAMWGVGETILKSDEDFITFLGNDYKQILLENLNVVDARNQFVLRVGKLEGGFWIFPQRDQVRGEINITDVVVNQNSDSLRIPSFNLQFDQRAGAFGIWVGDQQIVVPEIILQADGRRFAISGLQSSGSLTEDANFLGGVKQLDIAKLQMDEENFGPAHIQISMSRISGKAIADLLHAYQHILEHGELYANQLREKMWYLFPKLVVADTKIALDELSITTPYGQLQMSGDLNWPKENFVAPSDVFDMLQVAKAQLKFTIDKKFAQTLIDTISSFPYFMRPLKPKERAMLYALRDDMDFALRFNVLTIDDLVNNQEISESTAMQLLDAQEVLASYPQYVELVKKLLLANQISQPTAYLLTWRYWEVNKPLEKLAAKAEEFQKNTKEEFQSQLDALIKQGYVVEDNNKKYTALLLWENGKLKPKK